MAEQVLFAILEWGALIILTLFVIRFGKSFIFSLLKKKKNKIQVELKKTKTGDKPKKLQKDTIEILSTLQKIKAQAIIDKKTGKYKKQLRSK